MIKIFNKEKLRKFIHRYNWSIGYSIVVLLIAFGWQGLELLFYGEIQPRIVDDIIGIILFLSILINFVFMKVIYVFKSDRDKYIIIDREEYSNFQKEKYEEYYWVLKTLECNLKTADLIITNTIKNENGKKTSTAKFDSIKSFATIMKGFNDLNIQYIGEQLGDESDGS